MKRIRSPWVLPVLLLLASGCAVEPRPVSLERPSALAAQPEALTETQESALLPQPVTENQTFVTTDGIPQYKIGAGDVLEILLAREVVQERQTAAVKANGNVTVVFLEAKVAGLTAEQAAEELRRLLSPFYKQLSVEVLVKEYNSKKVTVLGAVAVAGKPGAFPLKGRTTLLDLLAEVGGPAPTADLERVRMVRQDGSSFTINFFRILLEGKLIRDLVLDAGDVVFIPTRGPGEEKKVFVLGEVKNPGAYPLVPNMRLSQAFGTAGGATSDGLLDHTRIIRGEIKNPQVSAVDLRRLIEGGDRSQDLLLQPNDIVFVPKSPIANFNAFLAKLRPSIEFLTLPFQPLVQLLLIRETLQRDRD